MMERSNEDRFDLDVRAIQATLEAIDCVAHVFGHESRSKGLTKSRLSDKIDRDPAYVARVLNGRVSNVNFQTIARMLIAMGYWPSLKATPLNEMAGVSNYCLSEIETSDYKRGNYTLSLSDNNEKRTPLTTNIPSAMVAHVRP
ncbi:MAG: hypothetical protein R3D56_12390 [Paracoccaceae bacterium]|jgi:transcriptional regulator with XRE-family HTH domain